MAKAKQEVVDFKSWYTQVGAEVGALRGKEYVSVCPECGKSKWHINRETGQHHCKTCGFEGNHYTFMQWMMDQGTQSGIEEIAAERGVSVASLQYAEMFKFDDEWWLPVFNEDRLITLRKWVPPTGTKGEKNYKAGIVYNLPKVALEGTFLYQLATTKKCNKVVLCEGPWDAIALYDSLDLTDPTKLPFSIWATPSATIFRKKWQPKFSGKVVYLAYDNDKAGKDGIELANTELREHCLETKQIKWPEGLADGYDVRDLYKEKLGETAEILFSYFEHHQPEAERPVRMKYSEIVADIKRLGIKTNQQFMDVFNCILATAWVSHLEGDPLWMYVVGAPGCLSGDTIVEINRAGKSYKERLDKVVQRFNGGSGKSKNGVRSWDLSIPTMIRGRDEDGCVRLMRIAAAIPSGKKEVFKLITVSGQNIEATADHQFLTVGGWKKLSEITTKDKVCIDVGVQKMDKTKLNKKGNYPQVQGLKGHPYAGRRFAVCKHRLMYEAVTNGYTYEDFIKTLRTETPRGIVWLKPEQIIHHKDENSMNYQFDNLELVESNKEHAELHCKQGRFRDVLAKTDFVKIKSIKKVGIKETYDLTIDHPTHNFLANGIVVHNSGKTLLTNSLYNSPHTVHVSKVTATQLVSGRNGEDGTDPSLIPKLDNLTLVMKDYTEIIDMGGGEQAALLSVLRGAYDRTLFRPSGIGLPRHYRSKFSIVAGVTGKIYQTTQASLGERFLRIHLDPVGGKDPSDQIAASMIASQTNPDLGMMLSPFVSSYIDYLKDTIEQPPTLTKAQQLKLIPIVRVVAHLREATAVGREREDLEAPPEIETGARTANQLQKLARGLCVVLQKPHVDEHIFGILRRVARDTCRGYYQSILNLCDKTKVGCTPNLLANRLNLSLSPVRRKLMVLKQLEILKSVSVKSGKSGRPEENWQLHPGFAEIWRKSGIGQ